jgi:uncharacterized protein (DUF1697 family)
MQMLIYISMLRGVNMAGHNKIKMTDLSALYKTLGFKDAETFIQSGNVVFSNPENTTVPEIATRIEKAILKKFNYIIPVIIRTTEELREVISINPFREEENFNSERLAVIFLYEKPSEEQIEKVKNINYPPDKFKIIGKEVFIYCPNGFGKSKIYTGFFENKMKVSGTGRNWNTINSLLAIAEKIKDKSKKSKVQPYGNDLI